MTARKIKPTISMPVITSRPSEAASAASLPHAVGVQAERALDRLGTGREARRVGEHGRLTGAAQGATPDQRGGGGPGLPVPGSSVRAELGAEGDERGQVGDRVDVVVLSDPDESVGVQVVPEEERVPAVAGGEEPRPPEVEEVPLVDRLDPESEAWFRQER